LDVKFVPNRSWFALAFALAALLELCGCGTARIELDSDPQKAKVYAIPMKGGQPVLLGETPVTTTGSEVAKQVGGPGPVYFEFRLDGHVTSKTLVSDLSSGVITLRADVAAASGLEDQEHLNSVMENLFDGQRLARAGRFDQALIKLRQVQKEAPQLAIAYELEGGVLFIQKKYKEALDAYGVTLRYNPQDVDALRMRKSLMSQLGVKIPGPAQPSTSAAVDPAEKPNDNADEKRAPAANGGDGQ
jgi:tetratricopeptide (TPR) repeat protein